MPDVIIIGDSHTAALKAGCDAFGLKSELLYLSGNGWHSGSAAFNAKAGLHFAKNPDMQQRVAAIRETVGGASLFSRKVPVIASIGYHLGRLASPFGILGHTPDGTQFMDADDRLFASQGVMAAYVSHFREPHFRMLARAARLCTLVVVAPPVVQADVAAHAMACTITARLRQDGVRVIDPRDGQTHMGATLAPHLLAADGVHGNARYGQGVIGKLLQDGLIPSFNGDTACVA